MLTNNLPESHPESHQQSQAGVSEVKAGVQDKTEPSAFWKDIGIPALGVVATLIAAGIGGLFVWFQVQDGNKRSESDGAEAQIARSLDRASQASKARQEVLTDYAKSMTELVTQRGLDDKPVKKQVENVATAATLVALRRLDDGRDSVESEFDVLKQDVEAQFAKLDPEDDNNQKARANSLQYLQGFNTEGRFKGHLIRFLYGSQLINGDETRVKLNGANVTSVDLNYAFLPRINLEGAWLTWGTFENATLWQANLTGADLREANLTGADLREANLTGAILSRSDLRGADLTGAILSKADLTSACYDTDTKSEPGIDLASLAMRKINKPAPPDFNCQQ